MSHSSFQSRRDVLAFLGSATALSFLPEDIVAQESADIEGIQNIPYTIADKPWPYLRGNHRAHVVVEKPADVVRASIPWRRLDRDLEQKAVIIFDPEDEQVQNVAVVEMTAAVGEVLFEANKPGDYFVYYLPHKELKGHQSVLGPKGQYMPPRATESPRWMWIVARSRAMSAKVPIPQARIVEFQARTEFESFYPMEVPATEEEVRELCKKYPGPILLFPEDREHPIKMYEHLPLRWIGLGPQKSFSGLAWRGELYVFQIGVYAAKSSGATSEPISLRFDDMVGPNGDQIPASAWLCVNTDVVDAAGQVFSREVTINSGKVVPLWCGVQVPLTCNEGIYRGNIYITYKRSSIPIQFELKVNKEFVRAGGVDEPWRLARIAWLNSTIGSRETVTEPYTALQRQERTVSCLGRTVRFAESGFPVSVNANGREMLTGPVELNVYAGSRKISWNCTSRVTHETPAMVVMASHSEGSGYEIDVETKMEFDGGIGCEVRLVSKRGGPVSEIALEIPYMKVGVPYAVGMSLKGGSRPSSWSWSWTQQPLRWKEQGSNLEYFLWMGDVHAGLYCRLQSPLDDWRNSGNGTVSIREVGDCVLLRAATGPRTTRPDEVMNFSFRLLPTPVKPINPDHWNYRYAQAYEPPQHLQKLDATVVNIHQGLLPNMYINYPFLNLDLLGPYISAAHRLGMKVKLYYTMRELTTRLPELWAFRSLGNEIYRVGGTQGQGNPQLDFWLQEHLHSDYSPGWITLLPTGGIDTSLRIYSDSRLANFYIEGLQWLLDNVPMDGLYLDEIGYSRSTMQRVRRVLQTRPGAMIDMHGNHDWWSCNCPIGYYMEHLPYIDRLWLGEAFDPDSPPDFWLIEMSGIPFGLSSDLLEHPNPWRGMLFGMTDRALYGGPSPTPIWELWRTFGIEDATMFGWWEEDVPVTTKKTDVLATAYVKNGKCLIAVASWASDTQEIQLAVDWSKLGMDPKKVTLHAPALDGLQEFQSFVPTQSLTVWPGKGYLLLLEQGQKSADFGDTT